MVTLHRTLFDLGHTTVGGSDGLLFAWWLDYVPHAVLHGHNPLVTHALNYPDGANALWNTSVVGLGFLLAPLTLVVGGVASYSIALAAAPVVSGLLAFLALRRWTGHEWLAATAGWLYAFCPFALAHLGAGHVNLAWTFLPPVLLLCGDELIRGRRRSPWLVGAALGLALAFQVLVSTEMLALGVLMTAGVLLALVVAHPRQALARAGRVGRGAVAALVVGGAAAGYPLYVLFRGPLAPRGDLRNPLAWVADAANAVVPTSLNLVHPTQVASLVAHLRTNPAELGLYLGPVLILSVVAAPILVRRTASRVGGLAFLGAFVASLGPQLVLWNTPQGVTLPWVAAGHVSVLRQIQTGRFSLWTGFVAVFLLVLVVDRLLETRGARWPRTVGFTATVLAVVFWLPAFLGHPSTWSVPQFFADGAPGAGDVVVTVPRASDRPDTGTLAMLWQAEAGFRYHLVGGYVIGGDAERPVYFSGHETDFSRVVERIEASGRLPGPGRDRAVRADLLGYRVDTVLVVPGAVPHHDLVEAYARRVLGPPAAEQGGVVVYPVSR